MLFDDVYITEYTQESEGGARHWSILGYIVEYPSAVSLYTHINACQYYSPLLSIGAVWFSSLALQFIGVKAAGV